LRDRREVAETELVARELASREAEHRQQVIAEPHQERAGRERAAGIDRRVVCRGHSRRPPERPARVHVRRGHRWRARRRAPANSHPEHDRDAERAALVRHWPIVQPGVRGAGSRRVRRIFFSVLRAFNWRSNRCDRASPGQIKSNSEVEAPGVEPARPMIRKPSAAPTCTVIARSWVIWNEAGEGCWESARSGESGSSGRQVGDKVSSVFRRWDLCLAPFSILPLSPTCRPITVAQRAA
jgi:hypothetical protein